jgi:DNA repair photolyase
MGIIYEPKGRAREYSPLAVNFYRGCDHKCCYCYAPSVLRMSQKDYAENVKPRNGIKYELELAARKIKGTQKQVLFNFIGDPYCAAEKEYWVTRYALELFREYKIPVAILTKGGMMCVDDIDRIEAFGSHIKVGATLTFLDDEESRSIEPGAALPLERLRALSVMNQHGVLTWASIEPVIEPEESIAIIKESLPVVDEYRLGKLNHNRECERSIDWPAYLLEALRILREAGKAIYVKQDLREAAPGIELRPGEVEMDLYNAPGWSY